MNSEEGISGTRYTTDSNMIALRGNIKSAQKLSLRCAYEDENTVLNFVCRDKQIVVSYTATNVEMITSRKNVTLTHKIYYKVCLFSTAQSLISLP